MSDYLLNVKACAILLALLISLPLVCGCSADKRAVVNLLLEKSGAQEPGTRVSWVRGPNTKEENRIINSPEGQWAVGATASSTLRSIIDKPRYLPSEATGPPNVPGLGLDGRGWGPEKENAGYEWLELTYAKPVHSDGIRVREVLGVGSIAMIQLKDVSGRYRVKWKGKDKANLYVTWLVLDFPRTDYLTNAVRVTLDTTRVPNWKIIDAVQLLGIH